MAMHIPDRKILWFVFLLSLTFLTGWTGAILAKDNKHQMWVGPGSGFAGFSRP